MKKYYGRVVIIVFLLFFSPISHGEIYKCDINGKISYSDKPCPINSKNINPSKLKQTNQQNGLSERGLYKPDDALITYDARTQLEWLDLSETVGKTYEQIINSNYIRSMGFRYATKKEVVELYFNAGVKRLTASYIAENAKAAEKLLKLFGCTSNMDHMKLPCGNDKRIEYHVGMFVHDYKKKKANIGQGAVEVSKDKASVKIYKSDFPGKRYQSRKASYLVRSKNTEQFSQPLVRERAKDARPGVKNKRHNLYDVAKEMVSDDYNPKNPPPNTQKWFDHVDKVKKRLKKTMLYAIKDGNLSQVKLLVSQGEDLYKEDAGGRNPLIAAARHGQYEIMKYFIDTGANINYRNQFGHTCLSQAVKKDHIELVKLLLDNGADPKIPGRKDIPVVITAIDNNNAGIVKLLLDAGTDPNLVRTLKGGATYNPIIRAASGRNDDIHILKLLIEAGGKADIVAGKRTVLHYGTLDGKHNNKIKYLLENGANPNALGVYGSPVAFSKGIFYPETLSILLKYGLDPSSIDKRGYSALMRVAMGINAQDKIKLLLDAGANLKYRTPDGLDVFDIINNQIERAKLKSDPKSAHRVLILEKQRTLIASYL